MKIIQWRVSDFHPITSIPIFPYSKGKQKHSLEIILSAPINETAMCTFKLCFQNVRRVQQERCLLFIQAPGMSLLRLRMCKCHSGNLNLNIIAASSATISNYNHGKNGINFLSFS
jgi:hypothetical protein